MRKRSARLAAGCLGAPLPRGLRRGRGAETVAARDRRAGRGAGERGGAQGGPLALGRGAGRARAQGGRRPRRHQGLGRGGRPDTLLVSCRAVGRPERVGLERQNKYRLAHVVGTDPGGSVCVLSAPDAPLALRPRLPQRRRPAAGRAGLRALAPQQLRHDARGRPDRGGPGRRAGGGLRDAGRPAGRGAVRPLRRPGRGRLRSRGAGRAHRPGDAGRARWFPNCRTTTAVGPHRARPRPRPRRRADLPEQEEDPPGPGQG